MALHSQATEPASPINPWWAAASAQPETFLIIAAIMQLFLAASLLASRRGGPWALVACACFVVLGAVIETTVRVGHHGE